MSLTLEMNFGQYPRLTIEEYATDTAGLVPLLSECVLYPPTTTQEQA